MSKQFKFGAVLIALTLLLTASLWAAGGSASTTQGGLPNVAPKGVYPIVDGPYTLNIAMRLNPNVEDIRTNYFTQHLQRVTGVSIDPIIMPDNDAEFITRVNLMFASNDLPEVITSQSTLPSSMVYDYGQSGQLIALNQYIDQYCVALQKNRSTLTPQEASLLDNTLTMPDGKIYSMPTIGNLDTDKYSMMTWVYMPWLEKLNIQVPKTLDDFYNMCMAFKTRDPNGNGRADEIPISNGRPQADRIVSYIGNAFQYTDWEWYLKITNGRVESNANNAKYRRTREYVRRLMADGLLDPQMYTQSNVELRATLAVPDVLVGVIPYASPSGYLNSSEEPMRSYDIIDMLEGPNGFKSTVSRGIQISHSWLVTNKCRLPAAAVRVADYLFSDEGWNYNRYGEKGVDWDDATGTDIMGNPASVRLIRDVYGLPSQNKIWRQHIMYFYDIKYLQRQNDAKDFKEYEAKKYIGSQMLKRSAPPEAVPYNLNYPNAEDEALVTRLKTELINYIQEMQALFVMGDLPLNDAEWTRYVNELNNRGLPRYVELVQRAYDNTK